MATVYLSPTGSDARTYAEAQNPATPWQTVNKANTSAVAGDTVYCLAGTYTWLSQTFSKILHITAPLPVNGVFQVVFDGAATPNVFWAFQAGAVTISNIQFQNVANTGSSGVFQGPFTNTYTITFNNCHFKTIFWAAINFGSFVTAGNFTWNGCVFNDLHGNGGAGSGFFIQQNETIVYDYVLNNCTVYLLHSGAGRVTAVFIDSAPGVGGDSRLTVKNCIFYNDTGASVAWQSGCTVLSATYSCVYNFTATPAGTGIITSDPLFVNAAGGDFRLRPTSTCLDTGTLV